MPRKITFGMRIKAWRKAQKPPLSQEEAAALFDILPDTWYRWERLSRDPHFETAEAVLVRLTKDGF